MALFLGLSVLVGPGRAQPARTDDAQSSREGLTDWQITKCARYKGAWIATLQRRGRDGLGEEFLARHEAFIDSGCITRADVCPRSAAEFEIANIMVLHAMNAGTASTFLPFACRGPN